MSSIPQRRESTFLLFLIRFPKKGNQYHYQTQTLKPIRVGGLRVRLKDKYDRVKTIGREHLLYQKKYDKLEINRLKSYVLFNLAAKLLNIFFINVFKSIKCVFLQK